MREVCYKYHGLFIMCTMREDFYTYHGLSLFCIMNEVCRKYHGLSLLCIMKKLATSIMVYQYLSGLRLYDRSDVKL